MNVLELSEQEIIRRNSMNELRAMGIEPYPAAEYVTNAFSTDIKAEFNDDAEPRQVSVAGRIMSRRIMGKASFIELQDSKGRIQVYITRDDICPDEDKEMYNTVFKRLLDLGDFIGIEGFVFRTQMGEISIHAKKLTVLAKSIKPLPIVKYKDGVAYDSFEDPELRYRQRYVDLIVNDGVKEKFLKRATVIKTMRAVLDEAGYTEVETPILQSIPGGASARPFITHHNSLDIDLYLRIATELYLKRLIVGGFEGVYEIGKNFRNEGMDKNHNPEFTCMELYVQYKDYNWMMSFTEKLLERICIAVNGCTETEIDGKSISFKAPYRRLPILEAIKENADWITWCKEHNDPMLAAMFGGHALFTISDKTFDRMVEANNGRTGYHIHVSEGMNDVYDSLQNYGRRPVQRLQDHGILGPKTILGHCIHVNTAEMEIIKETGTMVVNNPESNMGNAIGICPVLQLHKRGILLGMGTDAYTNDMLESLKVALCSQRSQNCLPNVGWCEVTDMLFKNNAKIGEKYFPDTLGVLKPGAAADIIVMDYKPYTPFSDENIDGHMIFGMTGRQCQTTIAAGKVLMKDRVLVNIDEEAENAHILEAAKKLWGDLNHRVY